MKSAAAIFMSPILCIGVLGGIVLENARHAKPEDASPYHAGAMRAIESWPRTIGDEWTSAPWEMPAAAVQLLRPNAKLGLRYINLKNEWKRADLLIVQCRDPNDMSGHYPPNCYPNNGEPLVDKHPRTWQVGDMTIEGMEYHFEIGDLGRPRRRCVYNFFILPGRGIVPDMDQVRGATGDYQRRYFGAAQFQVVFPPEMRLDVRDEIFVTIIGSNPDLLRTLNPSGI